MIGVVKGYCKSIANWKSVLQIGNRFCKSEMDFENLANRFCKSEISFVNLANEFCKSEIGFANRKWILQIDANRKSMQIGTP